MLAVQKRAGKPIAGVVYVNPKTHMTHVTHMTTETLRMDPQLTPPLPVVLATSRSSTTHLPDKSPQITPY